MPVSEQWLTEHILLINWEDPLTNDEIQTCFVELTETLLTSNSTIDLVFDVSGAGFIPSQAPIDFLKTRVAEQNNLRIISVVGVNTVAKMLVRVAARLTRHEIVFFTDQEQAVQHILSMAGE